MALNNVGLVLLDVRRVADALRYFDQALSVTPNLPEALSNRGTALMELKRYTEAAEDFTRLGALAPGFGGALGNLLYARINSCEWDDYRTTIEQLVAAVQRGELAATPLSFVCMSDSPPVQLACAQIFTATRYPPRSLPVRASWPYPHDRIRVAYLSGDFGEHAVSYLLAGVIEHHDRRRFEAIAIAWGRPHDGPTRKRLEGAFERFIDVTHISDIEVATRVVSAPESSHTDVHRCR
jgi:predicted O-linked N-acetylglucosamine transferase (SPINDLY family)